MKKKKKKVQDVKVRNPFDELLRIKNAGLLGKDRKKDRNKRARRESNKETKEALDDTRQ